MMKRYALVVVPIVLLLTAQPGIASQPLSTAISKAWNCAHSFSVVLRCLLDNSKAK